MKIEVTNWTKQVQYYGYDLTVPVGTVALATDGDGEIFAYICEKPSLYEYCWDSYGESTLVGRVTEWSNFNWTNSLLKV